MIKGEYDTEHGLKAVNLTQCPGGFIDQRSGVMYRNDARGLRVTYYEGHDVIGQVFRSHDNRLYLCDSWESNHGYWLTDQHDPKHRINVSECAIGSTYHRYHRSQLIGDTK